MSSLPLSVRLALWVSHAYTGATSLSEAITDAVADTTLLASPEDHLQLWAELGERVLLVALPRPGDTSTLPRGSTDFLAAAVESGECVYVPSLGGALVPHLEEFGSHLEPGLSVRWEIYDCESTPVHALDALSLRAADRQLRHQLSLVVDQLHGQDLPPWVVRPPVEAADTIRVRAGLPPSTDARAAHLIDLAARLGAIADQGLAATPPAASAEALARRERTLRRLSQAADTALNQAACVAALGIAGLRADRSD